MHFSSNIKYAWPGEKDFLYWVALMANRQRLKAV
jgi:hypothetical protein